MILSAFAFSIMALLVKTVGQQGIPVLEIVAARALVSLVISYYLVRRKGLSPLGNQKGWLLLRGGIGFVALILVFYGITHLPLAEATVLQYLHPMFTAMLAAYFLRERPTLATLTCIVLSFAGLLMIVRPQFVFADTGGDLPVLAVAAAIGGAFGSACAYILVRKLARTEDPLVIVLYFPLVSLPGTLPFLWHDFVMPEGITWLYLLGIGIATQVGQVALTKGMQTETAGRATSFSYLQVLFAMVWGLLFFAEMPALWTIAGALLILIGAYANLSAKR